MVIFILPRFLTFSQISPIFLSILLCEERCSGVGNTIFNLDNTGKCEKVFRIILVNGLSGFVFFFGWEAETIDFRDYTCECLFLIVIFVYKNVFISRF